jgi:hypothetical protein
VIFRKWVARYRLDLAKAAEIIEVIMRQERLASVRKLARRLRSVS